MTPVSAFVHSACDTDLNSLCNSVTLYHTQRDASGQIIDFRLIMANLPALQMWGKSEEELVGRSVSQLVAGEDGRFLIRQFSVVVEYGRPVQFDMGDHWQLGERQYTFVVSKQDDGVRLAASGVTDKQPAEQASGKQPDLLQKFIQHSSSMIDMLEAVRDSDGKIEDFTYRLINQAGLDKMGLSREQVIGHRLRTLFPNIVSLGVFDRLVTVVETGETHQQEIYCDAGEFEAWVDAKYIKHNDGVVTISFDLTAARLAERKQQQQAQLYKTIIDTALTSISVLEAVREGDGKGKIIDFRYTLVNSERLKMAGQPESFFIGRRLTELYPGMLESGCSIIG